MISNAGVPTSYGVWSGALFLRMHGRYLPRASFNAADEDSHGERSRQSQGFFDRVGFTCGPVTITKSPVPFMSAPFQDGNDLPGRIVTTKLVVPGL